MSEIDGKELDDSGLEPAELEIAKLEALARAMRGSLASLRAAAETLELFPTMEAAQRARLHGVVGEEAERLGDLVGRLERLVPRGAAELTRVEPDEVLAIARRAMAERGFDVATGAVDADVALRVDRWQLQAACLDFATALRRDFAVLRCALSAQTVDGHFLLDWSWPVDPADVEPVQSWQGTALDAALRPAVRRHDGEVWFDLEGSLDGEPRAHVRLLLPFDAPSPRED